MLAQSLILLSTLVATSLSVPHMNGGRDVEAASCFPAVGFKMPSSVPSSIDNWWCEMDTEYGFLGFSYEVSACQSASQLKSEFADIRETFNGRYVRLYGACDNDGFYDDVIEAAWENGLGVHALIWFGFDGGDEWETRRHKLIVDLHSNPKAPFVTRVVQFGSEPLYDSVLPVATLAGEVTNAAKNLSSLGIPVTISEMAYGYQENGDAPAIFQAEDLIDAHMLPYFSTKATTGDQAWPLVLTDLNYFIDHGLGKKIILTENGWPSEHYPGVEPNSPNAVSSVASEEAYYKVLDAHCTDFKAVTGGGVGWFWHIYSDNQEPGYGLYDTNGDLKFPFSPRTSC